MPTINPWAALMNTVSAEILSDVNMFQQHFPIPTLIPELAHWTTACTFLLKHISILLLGVSTVKYCHFCKLCLAFHSLLA